ncbi:MAG TPA: hypothetical protein VFR50_01280 [Casimicrobiaceae bacterium]|jgi:hypothetical protein|nr:hypothetical protein [Casimicrobiaceae bacterium]
MVSIGWVMLTFVLGGLAGIVILALIGMAGSEEDSSIRAEVRVGRGHRGPVHLHRQWRTIGGG